MGAETQVLKRVFESADEAKRRMYALRRAGYDSTSRGRVLRVQVPANLGPVMRCFADFQYA